MLSMIFSGSWIFPTMLVTPLGVDSSSAPGFRVKESKE